MPHVAAIKVATPDKASATDYNSLVRAVVSLRADTALLLKKKWQHKIKDGELTNDEKYESIKKNINILDA